MDEFALFLQQLKIIILKQGPFGLGIVTSGVNKLGFWIHLSVYRERERECPPWLTNHGEKDRNRNTTCNTSWIIQTEHTETQWLLTPSVRDEFENSLCRKIQRYEWLWASVKAPKRSNSCVHSARFISTAAAFECSFKAKYDDPFVENVNKIQRQTQSGIEILALCITCNCNCNCIQRLWYNFDNFYIKCWELKFFNVECLWMIGLMQTFPKLFQMMLLPKGQEMRII